MWRQLKTITRSVMTTWVSEPMLMWRQLKTVTRSVMNT